MAFELPALPYDYEALQPFMSREWQPDLGPEWQPSLLDK